MVSHKMLSLANLYSVPLLLQPLARMGATVTGVDAVEKNIKIARLHAVWPFSYLDHVKLI